MKKIFIIMLVSIFLLSACGPEPEPTMSAEEVQGTAVAAAWTMVAETQAAIPTATPIPPTETPPPTPIPTNTLAQLILPTSTQPFAVQSHHEHQRKSLQVPMRYCEVSRRDYHPPL